MKNAKGLDCLHGLQGLVSCFKTIEGFMAKDKKPKKGIFAKIENRDDALKTIKDTSIVSLVVAGIQVAIVVFLDPSFPNHAPFYAIFGLILMKWKSRTAAVLLLWISGLGVSVTIMRLGVMLERGANIILPLIVLWTAVHAVEATLKLHGTFAVDKKRNISKIGLIVLVCVICLCTGSVFYLIPLHETQHTKAKMIEVVNPMSNVASAVEAYNQEENTWPYCDNSVAIQTSLGVTFPKESTYKISSISVTSLRAEEVIITATIKGIHPRVDGKNLRLTGKPLERGILWVWGGTVSSTYVPKKYRVIDEALGDYLEGRREDCRCLSPKTRWPL